MRIVHLSTRPDYYGGEVCLVNLARGLAARGHEVSCLVQPGSALAARLAGGQAAVVPVPMVDWFDPGTVRQVRDQLRSLQPDLLCTHLPRDYFIAAMASRGLPICNIATRHQMTPLSWPLLKRPFLAGFGAVIAVSEAVARGVRHSRLVPPERVCVVANGIPEPVRPDPDPGPGLRERAGLSPEVPVIGVVGRLSPEKGADFLLRAAGRLVDRCPALQILLVGDGGERDGFRESLARLSVSMGLGPRVHFLGYVPDAGQRLGELEVLVVPSRAEPFGLVTLEALAAGVPVIATDAGGSPEIIRQGRDGFLVAPGDEAALAARLVDLLSSAVLRREMGQRGRERFRAGYSAGTMVNNTEAVYEDARRRSRPAALKARG